MKRNLHESDIQRDGGCASPARCGASRRGDTCLAPSTNRAFTLIELLVVVAIIAVLAALLLPTLGMAKNRAQATVDVNNMHQIMMAAHMYANDNDGYLPRPSDGWWDASVQSWCYSIPTGLPPGYGAGNTRGTYDSYYPLQVKSFKGLDSNGNALPRNYACMYTPYLKNEKALRCPADIPNTLMYERQVYITSYEWNGFVFTSATPYISYNGQTVYRTLKLSMFKADDILMWEGDELAVGGSYRDQWWDTVADPDETVTARHKGVTVGSADGSAERINAEDFYYWAWGQRGRPPSTHTHGTGWNGGQPLPNRIWCNPLSATGH